MVANDKILHFFKEVVMLLETYNITEQPISIHTWLIINSYETNEKLSFIILMFLISHHLLTVWPTTNILRYEVVLVTFKHKRRQWICKQAALSTTIQQTIGRVSCSHAFFRRWFIALRSNYCKPDISNLQKDSSTECYRETLLGKWL